MKVMFCYTNTIALNSLNKGDGLEKSINLNLCVIMLNDLCKSKIGLHKYPLDVK